MREGLIHPLDEVRAQGFSETFIQVELLPQIPGESAFATRNISVVQASWSNYHHEAVRDESPLSRITGRHGSIRPNSLPIAFAGALNDVWLFFARRFLP